MKPKKKECRAFKPHYKCGSNMGLCSECYRNQAIEEYDEWVLGELEQWRDGIPMYFGKTPPLIENKEWTRLNDLITRIKEAG